MDDAYHSSLLLLYRRGAAPPLLYPTFRCPFALLTPLPSLRFLRHRHHLQMRITPFPPAFSRILLKPHLVYIPPGAGSLLPPGRSSRHLLASCPEQTSCFLVRTAHHAPLGTTASGCQAAAAALLIPSHLYTLPFLRSELWSPPIPVYSFTTTGERICEPTGD